MTPGEDSWPALPGGELAPSVDYLRRLVQIAGKYTLDQLFEPAWGNIVLEVTPRGLSTRTLRVRGVSFRVHYRLRDGDVVLEASTGVRSVPLRTQSVAAFYADFITAAAELGLPAPGSTIAAEIPGAPHLDADDKVRAWRPEAAHLIWAGFNAAADALERWQAPYRGHRPRVGVMWGGFDLSAARYRGAAVTPPPGRPAFMQRGMDEEVVAAGFSFGSADAPQAAFYAYAEPAPSGIESWRWGMSGAAWDTAAGLAVLPWEVAAASGHPQEAVVAFADAAYDAAVELAGWPARLTGPRFDGWHASRTPPDRPVSADQGSGPGLVP